MDDAHQGLESRLKPVFYPIWGQNAAVLKNRLHRIMNTLVFFYVPAKGHKITRKKKEAIDPIARNITSLIGNFISIVARQGMNYKRTMACLRSMHVYPEIIAYYKKRGLTESDLREQVKKGLERRRLIGKAA